MSVCESVWVCPSLCLSLSRVCVCVCVGLRPRVGLKTSAGLKKQ